jgi:predicted ArsR family transcriptional regulator
VVERTLRRARALAHESRVAILHLLQQSPGPFDVNAIAAHVGLHRTTARDHLEHLVAAGYVARAAEVRTTRGRPRILYAAPEGPAVPPASVWFRDNLIKVLLAGYGQPLASRASAAARGGEEQAERWVAERGAVLPEVPAVAVGAFTGQDELSQLAVVEAHLAELGFEPEIDQVQPQIHLHQCPYLDLARENTEVVCSVHLGLARGVLALHGGPLTAERLEPFVGPQHCVLHLGRRAAGAL